MTGIDENLEKAVEFLKERLSGRQPPAAAIILGSGLGGLADRIADPVKIDYADIPGFVRSTAGGHRGQLIFGSLQSRSVVAMAGRFHRYEGWTNQQTGFPVRVMHRMGARHLIVSNAAGGVSPNLSVGDILILQDHLNWMNGFSSIATNQDCIASQSSKAPMTLGGPNRGQVYDMELAIAARSAAADAGFTANFGTYLATLGPTYETRAEYRMMRRLGADVAGMSTVPEVLVASALGMKILGLSMVSNVADPDRPIVADHAEVLQAGKAAEVKMRAIVLGVLEIVPA